MRNETSSCENSPFGIVPSSPWRLSDVRPMGPCRLYVKFIDGLEGFVDLSELIDGDKAGVFMSLRDPLLFKNVYIKYGAVSWPGDLDLAPDAMYDAIKDKGEWIVN